MNKFDNLTHKPTHSFDLGFFSKLEETKKTFSIFKFYNYIIAASDIAFAKKSFSSFLDFDVNEEEIEELEEGVIHVNEI